MKTKKELYLITPSFKDKYLIVIENSINKYNNLSMIQLRDKDANLSQTEEFIKKVVKIVNRANTNKPKKIKIILNSYNNFIKKIPSTDNNKDYLVNIYNLDGVQESLYNQNFKSTTTLLKNKFNILSCHSKNDILIAKELKYDAVTLSPIYKTNSHPGETRLIGIENLKKIADEVNFPIYILGGINFENIHKFESIDSIKGYAMISGFLNLY